MPKLNRPVPFRDQLRDIILDQIHSGELEAGASINLNELANDIGVSKTPVREALLHLEAEKLVTSRPGKGFFVPPLLASEAKEIYRAIGAVESAALRLCGTPPEDVFRELDELTRQRKEAREDALRNLELDGRWHEILLSHVDNLPLLETLSHLKNRMLRYEITYMYSPDRIDVALEDHRDIMQALKADRVEDAARTLQTHWSRAATLLGPEFDDEEEVSELATGFGG
jgi:DNA-binding GntR family transcriptional regulator